MQTLCLFHDDNAEPVQMCVTHPDSIDLTGFQTQQLEKILENHGYNPAGGLFLIPLHDGIKPIYERPTIYGQDGNELSCHFMEVV